MIYKIRVERSPIGGVYVLSYLGIEIEKILFVAYVYNLNHINVLFIQQKYNRKISKKYIYRK